MLLTALRVSTISKTLPSAVTVPNLREYWVPTLILAYHALSGYPIVSMRWRFCTANGPRSFQYATKSCSYGLGMGKGSLDDN